MRNKRFPISKVILFSFSYRFLVHDNANKTKRGKTLRSEIRKLSRASICCSKRGKKKKTTSTLRKHFESELSYLWFSTERNFWKRKSFPRARPENPAFLHNRHSIASSRLSNLWWWSSNFKLPWERENKASAAAVEWTAILPPSMLQHIPGRPNVYTGKGWETKTKKNC